eukprot:SAG22_NODE_29_length_28404_cov_23.294153_20_plen_117_part_00
MSQAAFRPVARRSLVSAAGATTRRAAPRYAAAAAGAAVAGGLVFANTAFAAPTVKSLLESISERLEVRAPATRTARCGRVRGTGVRPAAGASTVGPPRTNASFGGPMRARDVQPAT